MSQPNPYRSVVISALSADESSGARDVSSFNNVCVYLSGDGTTSSGVITIEEADDVNYGGTWSSIIAVNASDLNSTAAKAVHLPVGAYGAVRVRISTAIGGGGTVTAVIRGI